MKPSTNSLASLLRAIPEAEMRATFKQLRPEHLEALPYSWRFWARPEQLPPGSPGAANARKDWNYWVVLAGRGFGKTRAGAEFAIMKARTLPGSHGALVAPTADDARKTMLSAGLEGIQGASGILAISPPDFRPIYEPSKRIADRTQIPGPSGRPGVGTDRAHGRSPETSRLGGSCNSDWLTSA